MNGHERFSNQVEVPVDGFGLTKERRMETIDTNIDLILRRCQRTGVQPREMMLRAFNKREEIIGDYMKQIYRRVIELPDFNLNDADGHSQATLALKELYEEMISQQFNNPESSVAELQQRDIESRKQWKQAGIFSYELGEQHELILHIPPMIESPQLQQLKDSFRELVTVVKEDAEIKEICGSSLLLEHPIAQRFGLKIDDNSDEGFNPNFHMSRVEFLHRFADNI